MKPATAFGAGARRFAALVGCLFALALPGAAQRAGDSAPAAVTLLTNAQQIVALSNNVPPGRYVAKFEAVAICAPIGGRRLYVQNGEVGVQVNFTNPITGCIPGTRLEVRGDVLWLDPALRLFNAEARILGEGSLPDAPLVSPHRLARGEEAFRHVRIRGTVRDMVSTPNGFTLLVTHDSYPFEIALATPARPMPRHWTDAEVEVAGYAFPNYPVPDRPATGFRFWVNRTNDFRIITPGLADRFDGRPLMTIAEAAKLTNNLNVRYRVAGTVTAHRPGIAYYIDDGTGVMLVDQTFRHLQPTTGADRLQREPQSQLEPGERVEVIGARHNWFTIAPSLMVTEYRRTGRGPVPQPIPVTLQELLDGRHPGRLVTLTAQLIDARQWGSSNLRSHLNLVLRIDGDVFQAVWESEKPMNWKLPEDGYVRVTGVNDAEGSPHRKRSTFKLLLRTPADVVPVPPPPFWQRREAQRLAAAAGGVGLLSLVWILAQRVQVRRLERRVAANTAELRASEARKAAVLETALDSIITVDARDIIIDFNPAAERTFGYARADALGREMAELIIPPALRERHRAVLGRAVESGENAMAGKRVEMAALRRSGEEFPVELALARIRTPDGPLFTAHIQDISERKRAEAERERALEHERELSELKSRFVAMVSHEYRTPLGIIMSSAEILEAYLDRLTPEERLANVRDITQSGRHMAAMLDEVLLLGRVEAGKLTCRPAPMDLASFCARLADEVRSTTNGRCPIELRAPSVPESINADESLLRHILTNLLNNAVKYSAPGTPVEFTVELEQEHVAFSVRDRGIGIPEADQRKLFQAFHRGTNVGGTAGTGLGMIIVKNCVQLHRGSIRFESREGSGSTFIVRLPLLAESPVEQRKTSAHITPPPSHAVHPQS